MKFESPFSADKAPGVAIVEAARDLEKILLPDFAAAIWQRGPLQSFQSWIDGLPVSQLPQARVIMRPTAARRAAHDIIAGAGLPETAETIILCDDIAALAEIFANLMKTSFIRLRLEAVKDDACHKFHMDAVTARLICTYRGPGTEYGLSTDGGDPTQVFAAPTGSPMILCGSKWSGRTSTERLLHRSPPISTSGQARLMLVLDPVQDLDADA